MAITLDGTSGITTPDITSSGALGVDASAPDNSLVVDSSGNVGIGTSSPSTKLHLETGSGDLITTMAGASRTWQLRNQSDGNLGLYDSTAAAWRTFWDTSGNLLVGGTSTASVGKAVYIRADGANSAYIQIGSTASSSDAAYFYNSNGLVGSITTSGSSTSYNTSSDYRLKENVVGVTGASARVQQLNPVRFNFIADPDKTVDGFLAHEVQDVVPEAITGTKDAVETYTDDEGNEQTRPVYQGIDQSKLVPLLTAALQEAMTKIETLEARVAALEAA